MNEVRGHGIPKPVEPSANRPLPAGVRPTPSPLKNGASVVESSNRPSDLDLPSAVQDHVPAVPRSGFESILFPNPEEYPSRERGDMPACFKDLNLDQVVNTITSGRGEYNLKPFFYTSLNSLDHISYRHEIAQDLEDEVLHSAIQSFAERLRTMRKNLAQADELRYTLQKQAWFLEATAVYTEAILVLANDLATADIQSRGLAAFRSYVQEYAASDGFGSLRATVGGLKNDLAAIRYDIFTIGATFKVRRYAGEADYSAEIEETFAKFRQGGAKDYSHKLQDWVQMNDVEARILQFVAALNSEVFARLNGFVAAQTGKFVDKIIGTFDREVQFYLAYRAYMATMKRVGLEFCYPSASDKNKHVLGRDAFDIALASKLAAEDSTVVANDFKLSGKERILVVSGPNQGGKTTFARTFGQMHYLAGIGCQVPGREARLFLADAILTHFEREEDIQRRYQLNSVSGFGA